LLERQDSSPVPSYNQMKIHPWDNDDEEEMDRIEESASKMIR